VIISSNLLVDIHKLLLIIGIGIGKLKVKLSVSEIFFKWYQNRYRWWSETWYRYRHRTWYRHISSLN